MRLSQEVPRLVETNKFELQEISPSEVLESLKLKDDLEYFLTAGPIDWDQNQVIRRYFLDRDKGFISCVFWNELYYMTGTDIVKSCMYRMQRLGRDIVQRRKFEEGIFSDLRSLKCGTDATLESPKSPFLNFLFSNMCLKTQKKQKVFFWFSVPHQKLFEDALERDLKREQMGQPSTTKTVNEPLLSFHPVYDSSISFSEQLSQHIEKFKRSLGKKNESSPNNASKDTDPTLLLNTQPADENFEAPEDRPATALTEIDDDFPLDYLPLQRQSHQPIDVFSNQLGATQDLMTMPPSEFMLAQPVPFSPTTTYPFFGNDLLMANHYTSQLTENNLPKMDNNTEQSWLEQYIGQFHIDNSHDEHGLNAAQENAKRLNSCFAKKYAYESEVVRSKPSRWKKTTKTFKPPSSKGSNKFIFTKFDDERLNKTKSSPYSNFKIKKGTISNFKKYNLTLSIPKKKLAGNPPVLTPESTLLSSQSSIDGDTFVPEVPTGELDFAYQNET